jgi:hypothetical protein
MGEIAKMRIAGTAAIVAKMTISRNRPIPIGGWRKKPGVSS